MMQVPLEVSYRGVEKTPDIDALIEQKAGKLEEACDHLISCRVAVEKPQKHQESGNPYRVRIIMRVPPGHEVVVKNESSKGDMHDPLDIVIKKTFDSAFRKLKSVVEQQQGEVKRHPEQEMAAIVDNIHPEEDYGFLKTLDGRDIYFHRNSVLHNDFDRLEVGTGVRFAEEMGEKGPQATSVQIVDKPGSRPHENL